MTLCIMTLCYIPPFVGPNVISDSPTNGLSIRLNWVETAHICTYVLLNSLKPPPTTCGGGNMFLVKESSCSFPSALGAVYSAICLDLMVMKINNHSHYPAGLMDDILSQSARGQCNWRYTDKSPGVGEEGCMCMRDKGRSNHDYCWRILPFSLNHAN